jgi:diguanylate cyclase (GGDEF)-like protein
MQAAAAVPGDIALSAHILGAVLFALAFFFLWRRSRILFFGFWSFAWAMQALAVVSVFAYFSTGIRFCMALYLLFECAFGVSLVAAARIGPVGPGGNWRPAAWLLAAVPAFVVAFFVSGWTPTLNGYRVTNALLTGAVYLYSYRSLRSSARAGGKFFRYSLLFLSLAFLGRALSILLPGEAGGGLAVYQSNPLFDIVLQSILVFSAMAMWIESQSDRIQQIGDDLDRVRRESATNQDLDRLTGLQNQAALAKQLDDGQGFKGVVVVCDMDNFKHVNDRYGHLVGDEILRAAGRLLRSSIRSEDQAFRWGGDEFVILFSNLNPETARGRMDGIQARLQDFRVRGYGALPVSFSWGLAECAGESLRQPLDEADHQMYESKRIRKAAER